MSFMFIYKHIKQRRLLGYAIYVSGSKVGDNTYLSYVIRVTLHYVSKAQQVQDYVLSGF